MSWDGGQGDYLNCPLGKEKARKECVLSGHGTVRAPMCLGENEQGRLWVA